MEKAKKTFMVWVIMILALAKSTSDDDLPLVEHSTIAYYGQN